MTPCAHAAQDRRTRWACGAAMALLLPILAACAPRGSLVRDAPRAEPPPPATGAPEPPTTRPPVAIPPQPATTGAPPDTDAATFALARSAAASQCAFGDPIGGDDADGTQRVARIGYTLLHSAAHKTPVWVCEHYTRRTLISRYDRTGLDFEADPDLIEGAATPDDYALRSSRSLQIGHMAAAEAHTSSNQRLIDTFYLSNAVPQNQSLNGGRWARLEKCSRDLARDAGEAFVISGPVYSPDVAHAALGDGVLIPDQVWKVVLVEVDDQWRAWSVLFPNRKLTRPTDWARYVTTIDAIEDATGLDLFPDLDAALQDDLEALQGEVFCAL